MHASDVGFVFPKVLGTAAFTTVLNFNALQAIAQFGLANGIPVTRATGDCMCLVDQHCIMDPTHTCTIGGARIPLDSSNGGAATCGDTDATMDEAAVFLAAFGAH